MWRRQDDPKAASPPKELVVPPAGGQAGPGAPLGREALPTGYLSRAISVKGDISGHEDLFIEGEVQGSIRLTDGTVVVGPNGRVTAEVEAREIIVRGKVRGNLHGLERVEIGATGEVGGDVVTRRLSVQEGAIVRGEVDVSGAEGPRVSQSAIAGAGLEDFRPIPIHAKDSPR